MHVDGVPCGYIRAISESGEVYEGTATKDFKKGTYGWGREFVGDYIRVGWWFHWLWNGNCRRYLNGHVDQFGWFENSFVPKGYFDKDSTKYPYWEDKEIYWKKKGIVY